MRPIAILLFFQFWVSSFVSGQDMHFSQFYASPLNLNPALAGNFDGQYRFVLNQRRQWSSVTQNPFQTFGVSADAHAPVGLKRTGLGAGIYHDVAGDSRFNTLQINLAGSYAIWVKDSTQTVTAGLQVGMTNRWLDFSDLSFDRQFNGNRFDPNRPIGEQFDRSNLLYANLNLGINYSYRFAERKSISTGVSLFNLNAPNQTVFDGDAVRLDRRINIHARGSYPLTALLDLIPSFIYSRQGPFTEIDLGSSVKYVLDGDPYHYRAVYGGLWWRAGDAGFATIGMDYDSWNVGLSYDINVSGLDPASSNRGGWELSVIYILREKPIKQRKYRYCPSFI